MREELGNPANTWSMPIFCTAHRELGIKTFRERGDEGLVGV
jgi:hypothetical protein